MARRPRGRIAVVAPIRVLAGAGLRPVVALVVLNGFALQLNVFQVIFLAHRGFSAAQIAALPAVAAVASLLCLRVLKDRVPPARLAGRVAFAAAVGALGWLMFVAGPPGALAPVVAGTVLAAAGLLLMDSHLDALLIDRLDDRNRAEGLSALQSITALASVPAGAVAAFLYARNPVLPFVAIVLCQAGAAALALALRPARDNPMARIVRPE